MGFSDQVIQKVWEKAVAVPDTNAAEWRKDECGARIGRKSYGDRASSFGWDIDHITPVSRGGTDDLSNLRPLHWENNAARQAGRLDCAVTSLGDKNVPARR